MDSPTQDTTTLNPAQVVSSPAIVENSPSTHEDGTDTSGSTHPSAGPWGDDLETLLGPFIIKILSILLSHDKPKHPWEIDDREKKKLCTILCGKELKEEGILQRYLNGLPSVLWAVSNMHGNSISDTMRHIECLVALLEAENGDPTLTDFFQAGQRLKGWPQHSGLENNLTYANDLLWYSINQSGGTPRPARLKSISNQLFGPRLGGYDSEFSVTIKQIKDADITIKPTMNYHEHLLYKPESGVLYLSELDERHAFTLIGIEQNRIAQKVGIESLGREILASYRSLLSEDPTWEEAYKLGILNNCKTEGPRIYVLNSIQLKMRKSDRPFLLASREKALKKLIVHRNKWWQALYRDIQRQHSAQPFLFFGSVLALFFGVCQVIQTIAALLALSGPKES